ncbi:hypothetical protein ACIRSS_43015 [Amycolatopsis sp. NPDC101161]|uniref:hypothetical protein n=1 Tax=Amycolatopsis sp. NPDC101161 TaxID=3363940 RepID=UPI00382FA59E
MGVGHHGTIRACVTAWLVVRRDRYAELTAGPVFAGTDTERKVTADDREVRLAGVREFAERADRDRSLRQDFVDRFFGRLGHGWRETWPPGWTLGLPSPRKPGHSAEVVMGTSAPSRRKTGIRSGGAAASTQPPPS